MTDHIWFDRWKKHVKRNKIIEWQWSPTLELHSKNSTGTCHAICWISRVVTIVTLPVVLQRRCPLSTRRVHGHPQLANPHMLGRCSLSTYHCSFSTCHCSFSTGSLTTNFSASSHDCFSSKHPSPATSWTAFYTLDIRCTFFTQADLCRHRRSHLLCQPKPSKRCTATQGSSA